MVEEEQTLEQEDESTKEDIPAFEVACYKISFFNAGL